MEWLIGAILIAAILVLIGKLSSGSAKKFRAQPGAKRELRKLQENLAWMEGRWERAEKERERGTYQTVPSWHFDAATERQLDRIESIGLAINAKGLLKGQASDIIGLYETIEPEDSEILRFFKVSTKGFNQSRARDEVGRLLSDEANRVAWAARPASPWQKEFYRTFDHRVPKGLTHRAAADFISAREAELAEANEEALRFWEEYESIYEELSDSETRADYDIKSVSLKALREAVASLIEEGRKIEDLAMDLQIVVDRLIERNPSLYREQT